MVITFDDGDQGIDPLTGTMAQLQFLNNFSGQQSVGRLIYDMQMICRPFDDFQTIMVFVYAGTIMCQPLCIISNY